MEIDCVQRNNTFKFKLTLDGHNARLKLIYCLLPDPPRFSLPSTFKGLKLARENIVRISSSTVCGPNLRGKYQQFGLNQLFKTLRSHNSVYKYEIREISI